MFHEKQLPDDRLLDALRGYEQAIITLTSSPSYEPSPCVIAALKERLTEIRYEAILRGLIQPSEKYNG